MNDEKRERDLEELRQHVPPHNLRDVKPWPRANVEAPKPVSEFVPKPATKPAEPVDPRTITGEALMQIADSAVHTITDASEALDARAKHLREQGELCIERLRAWSNEYAGQYTEVLKYCTTLESTIRETTELMNNIGKKPGTS